MDSSKKYCCNNCFKQYTKKTSLENHAILCDFKFKTKREICIDKEEDGDTPTHLELVKIVQKLSLQIIKMEDKIDKLEKINNRQKKKINVVQWLNSNFKTQISFNEWVRNYISINSTDFEYLMNNCIFTTISKIFERNFTDHQFVYPICCFNQKKHQFYICDKNENNDDIWRLMSFEDFVTILRIIHTRLLDELIKWKELNSAKILENDKLLHVFNKAVIKLMNMTFTQDNSTSRIRNNLFEYLKRDIKDFMDYDFEFN